MPTLISSRFLLLVGESLHLRRALATSRSVLLHTSVKCMSQVEPNHGSLTLSSIGFQTETEAGNRSTSNKVKQFGSPSENLKSKEKPFGINEKKKKAVRVVEKQQIEFAPFAAKSFPELGLPHVLIERLQKEGFTVPTEVQSAAVPTILNNRDVIIQSYTGSGKTLAYLLPILSVVGPLRGKGGDDGEENGTARNEEGLST